MASSWEKGSRLEATKCRLPRGTLSLIEGHDCWFNNLWDGNQAGNSADLAGERLPFLLSLISFLLVRACPMVGRHVCTVRFMHALALRCGSVWAM